MLDGKYEITSERELGPHSTLFGATAPDGTALQISWYDLRSAAEEHAFERYRTLLRELRRGGHAAIYDLVARPGAHYVAWHLPETVTPPTQGQLEPIAALLQAHGRSVAEAQVCSEPGVAAKIFALPFSGPAGSETTSSDFVPASAHPAQAVDNLWITLRNAFRPWALGSVLALVGVLFLVISAQRHLQSSLVSVPEVRGQAVAAALETLYRAGFNTAPVALSSAKPTGTVIEVTPAVGTPLRPGRTLSVSYALSAGRAPRAVPAVTGQPLAEAEAALARAGFEVGELARLHTPAALGTVVAQTPSSGAQHAQGARVGLLVSEGPRAAQTFLPDLTGLTLSDALTLAEAAGLTRDSVQLERVSGSGAAADTVLAQNIAPFMSTAQNAQLRLTVAQASTAVAGESGTPDLIGLSLTEAQQRARSVGLSVTQTGRVSTRELPSGVVLQRPAPGTPLQGNVTVTVNVLSEDAPAAGFLGDGSETGSSETGDPESSDSESGDAETTNAETPPESVRRAVYDWQLPARARGQQATVTVTNAAGATEVLLRNQIVPVQAHVAGVYLTTVSGPLTFRLTLDGAPYEETLTLDP